MSKGLLITLVVIIAAVLVVALVWLASTTKEQTNTSATNAPETNSTTNQEATGNENVNAADNTNTEAVTNTSGTTSSTTSSAQKKSAHFESSTPSHGDLLPEAPVNVVINFNFDLAATSSITIGKGSSKNAAVSLDYATGATTIDENKLTMRRAMKLDAPDGLYSVSYNACWPDGSCHDGYFEFTIDRTRASAYDDLRNRSAVTVTLANFDIDPANIRISRGTTVTWQNDDEVGHYINTDGHPAHTYFLNQNSKLLMTGDEYAVTFTTPGFYPYHCSAHPDTMRGGIIVE